MSCSYPGKSTLWSYWMQAIEPASQAINAAFPDYHPNWVIQSQKWTPSNIQFKHLRQNMMQISVDECAAYMRVSPAIVNAWENGKKAVPFTAFELLRVVYESAQFRLSNKDWAGWFINHQGRLVSPDRHDLSFEPSDLSLHVEISRQLAFYKSAYETLKAEVAPLKAELEELRCSQATNSIIEELTEIENRLAEIAAKVNTKNIITLPTAYVPKEKKCA